jgi:PAS domain S-box-containing protein
MADRPPGSRPTVTLPEAATYLSLSEEAVRALVGAGYLNPDEAGTDDFRLPLADLKAFLARNADNGAGNIIGLEVDGAAADPHALLDALDGRADEMARRAFDIFSSVFPEASGWSLKEQTRFIDQAKSRFEAILAVTGLGAEVDEALVGDLQEVGAAAAWEGSPLPQLLVILRISRDLVVQTAVELAEERGRHWGLALSLLLTRVLPAMDRLTDALAQGYWAAILSREEEAKARYENVVENSSDGIYEVDVAGRVIYVNESLAVILGRRPVDVEGTRLSDVLQPLDEGVPVNALITDSTAQASQRFELTIARADGVRRVVDIRTLPRMQDGELIGFQGVVSDVTTAHDLEAEKNEFLALVTHDLRNPLTTILGLGATLESHAEELEQERIARMGGSIRRQAERISRLADDLYDMSRLEAHALLLTPRPVDVAATVEAALAAVEGNTAFVEILVPAGITVLADPRRLEQVIANLVENGLQHGDAPVMVELVHDPNGMVELAVRDHGPGVPPAVVGTLFSRSRTLGRRNRDRSRGTGLGLSLVRGLVEAMGGRVWYEAVPGGGASFRLSLPVPRRPH